MLLDFPDVVTQILPELGPAVGFDQRNPHHRWDVYTHSVKTAALVPPSPALRLAALLHDVGKPASFFLDERGHRAFLWPRPPGRVAGPSGLWPASGWTTPPGSPGGHP